jgi:hypothetical protein
MSVLLLMLLVVPAGVLTGCGSGAPSKEDIEGVVLSYLKNDVAAITDNPGRNVRAVELIEIGESFEQGRQTMWPVKVNILKSGGAAGPHAQAARASPRLSPARSSRAIISSHALR